MVTGTELRRAHAARALATEEKIDDMIEQVAQACREALVDLLGSRELGDGEQAGKWTWPLRLETVYGEAREVKLTLTVAHKPGKSLASPAFRVNAQEQVPDGQLRFELTPEGETHLPADDEDED